MADFDTLQSPNNNYRKSTSSFFTSNRLFTSFVSKSFNEPEPIISPTSILDIKPFSPLKTPFSSNPITPKQEIKNLWEKSGCLGLIEALTDDNLGPNSSQPGTRTVLFGSQLKIQVSPSGSPKSPRDFGIKTMHSHVGPNSPNLRKSGNSGLSAIEMELSEDYTCVISYGPNPKTTHIFEDCIVDSCCGVVKFSESRNGLLENRSTSYPSDSFLSHCHGCKKNLGQGDDIYMYRGEKAFCSEECRLKEMMMMEWIESGEF